MEIILAKYFDYTTNLIVPNVHWGMFNYELDLIILSKAGYATEIEIKISKSDLIKDKNKFHNHENKMIKNLYFAIPEYIDIDFALENIPNRAGLLVVKEVKNDWVQYYKSKKEKKPISSKNPYKWNDEERYKLARLGAIRIWNLKNKIINNPYL
jgi:hypothetical protein